MKHFMKVLTGVCSVALLAGAAYGGPTPGRVFCIPSTNVVGDATAGMDFPVNVDDFPAEYGPITITCFFNLTPPEEVIAYTLFFPCSVPCSVSGSVDFIPGTAAYVSSRPDDFIHDFTINLGGSGFGLPSQGPCPGLNPGIATTLLGPDQGGPPIPIMLPNRFIGQAQYTVSNDCVGTAVIEALTGPDLTGFAQEDAATLIPFTSDGVAITVPTGQCCDGVACLGTTTKKDCDNQGGTFNASNTCPDDPCSCNNDNANCEDGNACTNDVCTGLTCTFPSNVPAGQCCNPAGGPLTPIDDNNECTADSCDPLTGAVTHAPLSGTACTDDGNVCSLDNCAAGVCGHIDITSIPCLLDADCVAASGGASQTCGQLAPGFCDCVANPPLTIECDDGEKPNPACFQEGEKIVLKVVVGGGTLVINGGQFRLVYDPACLDFLSVAPGAACDVGSPYEVQIFEQVNEATGEIFYAVGIALFQNGGTNDGGTLACLSFNKIGACTDCEVCFDDLNPQHTYLSGPGGDLVLPDLPNGGCGCSVQTNGTTTVTVPDGGSFNADCDSPTAIVTWASSAAASDTCEGPLGLACTCEHSNPLVGNCDNLIAHGGEFPQGLAEFECCATDDCGVETCGQWTVFVSDETTMDVVLQLSPTMDDAQFTRCIEFGFYSNCVEAVEIFKEELVFGPPWDFPGHATYDIKVPKGQYDCLTARDQVHTLRSVSDIECGANGHLSAEFKGDPFFGGNWLIGGNLDGSHVIDILDFGVLVGQYSKPGDASNNCIDIKVDGYRDADINADGVVDALDYAFIVNNFLEEDKDSCCPDLDDGGAAGANQPVYTSITVQQLRELGLGDLVVADLNRDGVLDTSDMEAFQAGVVPGPARNAPKSSGRR